MLKILMSIFAVSSFAGPTKFPWMGTLSEKTQTFTPANPQEALQSFSLVEYKKKVMLDPRDAHAFYMTITRAVLKTDTTASLEDYLIVQYIRGCIYESTWDGKTVTNLQNVVREHFSKYVPFRHPEFTIDTDNPDPAFSSFPGYGRYAMLYWNVDPDSLDVDTAEYYGNRKAPHPVAFTSDIPGPATLEEDGPSGEKRAQNTSLEFKTCVFHTRDVPLVTDETGKGLDIKRALKCFNWEHKYIYDFKKKSFDVGGAIHPFCR